MDESWHRVVDLSIISNPINEAVYYEKVMEAFDIPIVKEPSISNPNFAKLVYLTDRDLSILLSMLSAILSHGKLAGHLGENERQWCAHIANANASIQDNALVAEYISNNYASSTENLYISLSLWMIRCWSKNNIGFWERFRLRLNHEIAVPEIDINIPENILDYLLTCATTIMSEPSPPATLSVSAADKDSAADQNIEKT
ncbi:hypothetical protein A8L45_08325 [Veronia pacifica]|uniref:Uncharacterized protein n=2 Tax=Veronia pacifica TaxID=1080227 RepID=A0A1C3ELE3_9GAMM|nr:hypothetical protein A8L45_08325 [Veronia pacifica]